MLDEVLLPEGMEATGAVLPDQPRTVQSGGRRFAVIEHAPHEVLEAVKAIVGELLALGR